MKLLPAFLASTTALERGLEPEAAIQFAHNRVRNGFTLPEMDQISEANERIIREAMEDSSNTRLLNLEEMFDRSVNITTSFLKQGECDSSFPTLDGSCNHPEDAGRSLKPYKRLVPADYCNNRDQARCGRNNRALPDERTVSLAMGRSGQARNSPVASYAFTAWGQFMTHDMIQTPDVGNGQVPCNCNPHPSCKNIVIPKPDPVLTFRCMFVIRSSSVLGVQNNQPVREQINQLSSFIDGTTIYGFTTKHKNLLLASDRMHLRMQNNGRFSTFLPNVDQINDREVKSKFETSDAFNDKGHSEFVAGDTRVLENPVLSSFHIMFARLHNKAVDGLLAENPHWAENPEKVFQEARLFVMSVLKQINYREHLPVLLGANAIRLVPGMRVSRAHKRPKTTRFVKIDEEDLAARSQVRFTRAEEDDPSIRQEFMAAAYRFGHAMVPEQLVVGNSNLQNIRRRDLKDNYFDPDMVFREGPGACLRGASIAATQTVSGVYADATQHNLFKPNNFRHGVDLLSINLARGREHGVGTYKAVKDFCKSHPKYGTLYPNGNDPVMQNGFNNVRSLYAHPDDVDLYTGILMEREMTGAIVGPTAGCIIADQFIALRKGDRFWHENKGVFSDAQLQQVKSTTLAKVMCETMEGMTRVTPNPFVRRGVRFEGASNDPVSCGSIGSIDFSSWKERSESENATPAPATTTTQPDEPEEEDDKGEATPAPVTPRPPIDTTSVDRTTIACRLVNGRRNGLVQCGTNNQWTNGHLVVLADRVKQTNAIPIRGKRQTIARLDRQFVKRLSFSNNPNINDTIAFSDLVTKSNFPELLELDISFTGLTELPDDLVKDNDKLGVVDLEGTSVDPSHDFTVNLFRNLKGWNRMVFFG